MKTPRLNLILAILAMLAMLLSAFPVFAADELAPEHANATPYRVGDIVTVTDLDGQDFPMQILALRLAEGVAELRSQAGEKVSLPIDRIREKAGRWFRFASWLRDTNSGNWTAAGTGLAVAAVGAKTTLDVSEKDNDNRVDAATAAAQSDLAAANASRSALTSGTPDGSGFFITGTFTGSEVPVSATARYTPAITFGRGLGSQGGAIALVTLPPDANGQPQEQRDVGRWSAVSATEISISDLPAPYAGVFKITGIAPYGSASASPATLEGPRGVAFYGGYVIAATAPQGAQP